MYSYKRVYKFFFFCFNNCTQTDTEKLETIKSGHQTPIAPQYESFLTILDDPKPSVSSSALTTPFLLLQLLIFYRILFKYCT